MTNLLPIGTVVRLHNGTIDVMIIGRFPLYNQEGTIGYFDYVRLMKILEKIKDGKELSGWCESARSLSKTLWMAFDYLYDKYGDKVVEFAGDVWDGTKKVVGDTMKSVGDAADKI